jgi:sterol desaturase/sphingolipid hydroxylase (fatty acid hydroxylase superfamily)
MIGFPLALLYMNLSEWVVHRYVLHGLGRRRESFWSFHWHEHHRHARRTEMRDADYARPVLGAHAQGKEAAALLVAAALHLPLARRAPWFTAGALFSIANYYRVHKRSHRDPSWAKAHLPWHYDHHMGPDQDANWCVSHDWFDRILGTRKPWVGTDAERARTARRATATHAAAPAP